jgi:hypothetical protein
MIEESVPGFDLIRQAIGEGVKDFNVIRGLRMSYDDVNSHCNADIEISNETDTENIILVSCIDVSKYTANFSDIGKLFVSGLQIFSRSSDQIDRIGWELSDYEDGKIVIFCRKMGLSIK